MKNLSVSVKQPIPIKPASIHSAVSLIKKKMNFSLERLEISFISGDNLLEVNKTYLKHNYKTDIITFNYSETKDSIDGEILISVDDAAQNAKKYGVTVTEELIRLVAHGILHLLGFDDTTTAAKKVMMKMQETIVTDIYSKIK